MTAIANLVLADGQSTPVNHTFTPLSVIGDLGSWRETAALLPIGFRSVNLSISEPTNGSTVYRAKLTIAVPHVVTTTDAASGSTTSAVDYTTRASLEFILPSGSSTQDRKDILAFVKNALADAQVTDVVWNLNHVY